MMRETGTGTDRSWDDAQAMYRQDFDRRYGASGSRWEEAGPGYH